MKFSCLQESLANKLAITSKAVAQKSTLSLLSNIKMVAKDKEVRLSATNLQFSITTSLASQVTTPGELAIPGQLFTQFLSSLPAQKLNLEVEKGSLKVESLEGWASMRGVNADDFPPIREELGEDVFTLKSSDLKTALSGTLFATASDDSRPILTGALIYLEGKTLKLVGVDGFRLSEYCLSLKEAHEPIKVVVPTKTLQELQRLLSMDEKVKVSYIAPEKQVAFEIGDVLLVSRVLEGNFPEYQQIIPQEFKVTATLSPEEFRKAISRVSLFSEANSNVVKLSFDPAQDELVITAQSQDVGNVEMKLPCKITGEKGTISFNAKYLSDVLNYLETIKENADTLIELSIKDSNSPGLFKVLNNKDYLHIVMPVRMQ